MHTLGLKHTHWCITYVYVPLYTDTYVLLQTQYNQKVHHYNGTYVHVIHMRITYLCTVSRVPSRNSYLGGKLKDWGGRGGGGGEGRKS